MKSKFYLFAVALLALVISGCSSNVYKAPELSSRTSAHKKIAIIPFNAVIKYKKLPKNQTLEDIKKMEEDLGYTLQEQMYTNFLQKIKKYNIEIQDVSQTTALLKKNNISFANMDEYTKDEIARILGVDAVVSGKVLTSKPMSGGAALAVGLLTGGFSGGITGRPHGRTFGGTTNQVDVNLSLHDGTDARLLYKYDHVYNGSLGSTPESLTRAMMKDIANKFPYKK